MAKHFLDFVRFESTPAEPTTFSSDMFVVNGSTDGYNQPNDQWSNVGTFPAGGQHAGGGSTGNYGMVISFNVGEKYDIGANNWSTTSTNIGFNSRPALTGHSDGLFYHYSSNGGNGFESIDPASDTPTTLTSPPADHGLAPRLTSFGDKLYLIGGDITPTRVDEYDVSGGSWTNKTSSPENLDFHAQASNGSFIYCFGGEQNLSAAVRYDPNGDSWTTLTSDPQARQRADGKFLTDGRMYVVGGWDSGFNNELATLNAYDPATDSWDTSPTDRPVARAGPAVFTDTTQ